MLNFKANPSVEANLRNVAVLRGDTIDFIVDSLGDYESDEFTWAPELKSGSQSWNAQKEFAGPLLPRLRPFEQLAQVLMLTNEFAFID